MRRRILELLAEGERPAGDVAAIVGAEFGISQPAVSQHLRVLREHGFASVRAVGTRRLYAVDPTPFSAIESWLAGLRRSWEQRLDALAANATGSASHIARAVLLGVPPSIDAGEITDKGSINQRAVMSSRARLVEDLYAEPAPDHVLRFERKAR